MRLTLVLFEGKVYSAKDLNVISNVESSVTITVDQRRVGKEVAGKHVDIAARTHVDVFTYLPEDFVLAAVVTRNDVQVGVIIQVAHRRRAKADP